MRPQHIVIMTWAFSFAALVSCSSTRRNHALQDIRSQAMSAGYRGDLAALRAVAQHARLQTGGADAAIAHYWASYALWQRAMNGVNLASRPEEVSADLHDAVDEMNAALHVRPDFADADALLSLMHGWLISVDDPSLLRTHATEARAHMARAKSLEPRNPRVLWAEATNLINTPPQFGGDPKRGLALLDEIPAAVHNAPQSAAGPLWGEAESHMSIAYALVMAPEGDALRARREADAALQQEPEWSYVRDTLIPMIDSKQKAAR